MTRDSYQTEAKTVSSPGRPPESLFEVEIVDVNANPGAASEHGIFITPTLHVLEPEPGGMVYGNLNDTKALQRLFRDDR